MWCQWDGRVAGKLTGQLGRDARRIVDHWVVNQNMDRKTTTRCRMRPLLSDGGEGGVTFHVLFLSSHFFTLQIPPPTDSPLPSPRRFPLARGCRSFWTLASCWATSRYWGSMSGRRRSRGCSFSWGRRGAQGIDKKHSRPHDAGVLEVPKWRPCGWCHGCKKNTEFRDQNFRFFGA